MTSQSNNTKTELQFFKPYLGLNDIEILLDYILNDRLCLRTLWDEAAAENERELFMEALCNVLAKNGCPLEIVRTKENGEKIVIDLSRGFITNVFEQDEESDD